MEIASTGNSLNWAVFAAKRQGSDATFLRAGWSHFKSVRVCHTWDPLQASPFEAHIVKEAK